jgi:H/ACA ribonucleoprotein complex subunit 3
MVMAFFIEKKLEIILNVYTNEPIIIFRIGVLMKSLLYRCYNCNIYTLKEICPNCQGETTNPAPPRFSPEDKYGKYRRLLKKGDIKRTE